MGYIRQQEMLNHRYPGRYEGWFIFQVGELYWLQIYEERQNLMVDEPDDTIKSVSHYFADELTSIFRLIATHEKRKLKSVMSELYPVIEQWKKEGHRIT